MTKKSRKSWIEARGLIRREGDFYLIARPNRNEDCPWEFPGGRAARPESPEAALRRHCRDGLGITINIHVGQPPFQHDFGTHAIVYRYYLCDVASGEATAKAFADIRWILKPQLRDYVFDAPTQQVVDWLVEEPAG